MELSSADLIYIFGSGRSGSTLITSLLNMQKGLVGAGELNRGFVKLDRECACGNKIQECEFWKPIIESIESETGIDSHDFYSTNASLEKKRSFFLWLAAQRKPHFIKYINFNTSLVRNLQIVEGGGILVDSSKNIMRYYLLKRFLKNIGVIHSVRNPRAVLFSNEKKYNRKGLKNLKNLLRFKPVYLGYVLFSWNITNFVGYLMGKFNRSKYIIIKYEEIAFSPRKKINEVTEKYFQESFNPAKTENHNLYGNRMLHSFDLDKIKPDNDWKSHIKWYHNLAVHLLTFPTIWIYGYGSNK